MLLLKIVIGTSNSTATQHKLSPKTKPPLCTMGAVIQRMRFIRPSICAGHIAGANLLDKFNPKLLEKIHVSRVTKAIKAQHAKNNKISTRTAQYQTLECPKGPDCDQYRIV